MCVCVGVGVGADYKSTNGIQAVKRDLVYNYKFHVQCIGKQLYRTWHLLENEICAVSIPYVPCAYICFGSLHFIIIHVSGELFHTCISPSTPLQESSDVIISGLRSELNQNLEEMTSYHQVTLSTMGRARSYWMAWVPLT